MALPIFAITLFISAFLLFLVQPMIGKLILPKLGGTPQVWNTCMVFFQSVLLLGYAYTHSVSTKLKLRQQLMVHGGLLVIPIILVVAFPFYQTVKDWDPPAGSNPIPETLMLLAWVVGIPFFVVSTSAPLLQRWFAYSGDPAAKDPYFLYGASNLGSLLSLLFYPALIEPWTELKVQTDIWLFGYIALAACIGYCAFLIYKMAPPDDVLEAQAAQAALAAEAPVSAPAPTAEAPPAPAPVPAAEASTAVKPGPGPSARSISRKKGKHLPPAAAKPEEAPSIAKPTTPAAPAYSGATAEMTPWRRIRWVLLAAVPSSLMLGVTSFISTDLSPFPLVWVIPLALYLLSFILVYMKVWTGRRFQVFAASQYTLHDMVLYVGQPLGLIVLCFIILSHQFNPFWVTFAVMFGFFMCALVCHGELAQDRPATKHLTEYFLLMSVGGMVGGVFNGLVAPVVFQRGVIEFHIAIVVACLVRPQYVPSGWLDEQILNAFPGLQAWSRNQGNELAKSMGRPAPNTTYVFSYLLDIVFGIFILSISYWLITTFIHHQTPTTLKVAKFLQMPVNDDQTRAGIIAIDKWTKITFNVFVYFVPMVFCFFFAGRPLRLTLAVAGLLMGNLYFVGDSREVLEARRTYFGLLRVMQEDERPRDLEEAIDMQAKPPLESKDGKIIPIPYKFTYLMHGTTYHGRNYYRNVNDDAAKYRVDLSRLATTYYHRYGPVGVVMEQYNWFPGKQNSFHADARLPASLVGQISATLGLGTFPMAPLVETQSEPPLATIGLGTGTMASYARPFGHFTYYEIDDAIRHFSLPEDGSDARFTFLQNAIRRGVNLEVLMGDARQTLEREEKNIDNSFVFAADFKKYSDKTAYHAAPYNHDKQMNSNNRNRDGFYKVIVVDAFSSDAIPVHLVTKQAIQLYLSKLSDDGVLCVHTSNRHMDLVRPVARIALELKVNCVVGKDLGDKGRYMGHFTSEYVMLYRGDGFKTHLDKLEKRKKEFIANRNEAMKKEKRENITGPNMMRPDGGAPDGHQILNSMVEWYDPYTEHVTARGGAYVKDPITTKDSVWTDDFTSILPLLR